MNCIDKKFEELKKKDERALIGYFPLGDVGLDCVTLAKTYIENGVDVLEIGYPVKNPYLDGSTVADSMHRILNNGFTTEGFFDQIKRIRAVYNDHPLIVMGYKQIFDDIAMKDFFQLCVDSKVDGVLIADASFPEWEEIDQVIPDSLYDLRFIPFQYTKEHMDIVATNVKGYIFLQAVDGATGMRENLDEKLEEKIQGLKNVNQSIPICPGFGISNAKHCKQVREINGDGLIIGSAFVNSVTNQSLEETGAFIRELKAALS